MFISHWRLIADGRYIAQVSGDLSPAWWAIYRRWRAIYRPSNRRFCKGMHNLLETVKSRIMLSLEVGCSQVWSEGSTGRRSGSEGRTRGMIHMSWEVARRTIEVPGWEIGRRRSRGTSRRPETWWRSPGRVHFLDNLMSIIDMEEKQSGNNNKSIIRDTLTYKT